MLKFLIVTVLLPLFLSADPALVTQKSLDSRDPERICKELNWKLAARECGQKAKDFKNRTTYENCKGNLRIVTQVHRIPVEDAKDSGPHMSCSVKAMKGEKLLWARRHRIYADRIVSERDKYSESGSLDRFVKTSEGILHVKKNADEDFLEIRKGKDRVSNVSALDYFSYIQGKRTFADLQQVNSRRMPANAGGQ